jgi:hypothetical protein
MFSTFDRDNDKNEQSCAARYHGAWWYYDCYRSHLNGLYSEKSDKGIGWHNWIASRSKTVEMIFR